MVQVAAAVELDRIVQLDLLGHIPIVNSLLKGLVGNIQVVY